MRGIGRKEKRQSRERLGKGGIRRIGKGQLERKVSK